MQSVPQPTSRPEKIARFASWVIALLFASMLNYLGSLVIRDIFYLPGDGPPEYQTYEQTPDQLALKRQHDQLQNEISAARERESVLTTSHDRAQTTYREARQAFDNWVATRGATNDAAHNGEVVTRTHELDKLLKETGDWQAKLNAAQDATAALTQQLAPIESAQSTAQQKASERYAADKARYDLKVFAVRLAVILPLMLLAIWLFVRYRKHRYWPFVYGFGLFALFSFFVELAPYLPSFGGYIRAGVGIVLTALAGVYLIGWLQRYLARKAEEQRQNQLERTSNIAYDRAMIAYRKHLCPGCDREYRMAGEQVNFCPHCGLTLFANCYRCNHRNFAFFPYCSACGVDAPMQSPADQPSGT